MMLAELMKARGEVTPLADGEVYEFLVEQKHTLRLRHFKESSYCYIYAKVRRLTKVQATRDFLGRLLEANLFSGTYSNTYFAWHPESESLVLCASFDEEALTDVELQKGIETFVGALDYWKAEFAKLPDKLHGEDLLGILSQKKQVFFS